VEQKKRGKKVCKKKRKSPGEGSLGAFCHEEKKKDGFVRKKEKSAATRGVKPWDKDFFPATTVSFGDAEKGEKTSSTGRKKKTGEIVLVPRKRKIRKKKTWAAVSKRRSLRRVEIGAKEVQGEKIPRENCHVRQENKRGLPGGKVRLKAMSTKGIGRSQGKGGIPCLVKVGFE